MLQITLSRAQSCGTRGGTQRNITSHLGPVLRTVRGGVPGARVLRKCSVLDCEKAVFAREWCHTHYFRWWRHGDPLKISRAAPRTHPSYRSAHERVDAERGAIRLHACVDCGKQARHWALKRLPSGVLLGHPTRSTGRILWYSLVAEDYEPRCVPCHQRFDGITGRRKQTVPRP